MTHANAYGLQASECPGGQEAYVPSEPEKDCGVDPFTGSGKTFAQASGYNTYLIRVRNVARPPSGPKPGSKLSCAKGTWEESPTSYSYEWLRNGAVIAGATASEYTIVPADEGKDIQCVAVGSNTGGSVTGPTKTIVVAPEPITPPPSNTKAPEVNKEGGGFEAEGTKLTCTSGTWTGSATLAYQWLRNAVAISGATSNEYAIGSADRSSNGAGNALQCQVTATNAGGSVVADNPYPVPIAPQGTNHYPGYPEEGNGPKVLATVTEPNETTGTVIIADRLPNGLTLAGNASNPAVGSPGWMGHTGEGSCAVVNDGQAFSCTATKVLSPGESYPTIVAHVRVMRSAPTGTPPTGGVTNTAIVSGGGAADAQSNDHTATAPAVPFGIDAFTTSVTEALGSPLTQAGGRPFAATATLVFNYTTEDGGELTTAGGTPKTIETDLPPGFVGDPNNATPCTAAQLAQQSTTGGPQTECPSSAIVGFTVVKLDEEAEGISKGEPSLFANSDLRTAWVYNLKPPPSDAAAFAFFISGASFVLDAHLLSDNAYEISLGDGNSGTGLAHNGVLGVKLTLCGFGVRGHVNEGPYLATPATAECASPSGTARPLLTNPSVCSGPAPTTTLVANTYQEPDHFTSKTVYNGTKLSTGEPNATESFVTGCNLLQFAPEIELTPASGTEGTTGLDSPSGAQFNLKIPQAKEEAGTTATPALKTATVTLPEGMTANPAAVGGLESCSDAQFGLGSTAEPAHCPLASQVGAVEVCTPLLTNQTGEAYSGEEVDRQCEEGRAAPALQGEAFIGQPECSPCSATDADEGKLFRLFLQVRAPNRGIVVKLAGLVSANPLTGRLQATFAEQPQLPFGEFRLKLKGGPRAPLATPQTCGAATSSAVLTPWSAPGLGGPSGTEPTAGTSSAAPTSIFTVDWNGAGGICPSILPFSPTFAAGTESSNAGASSPLSVSVSRQDREQDLSVVTVSTPPGLVGRVSEVRQCGEAEANAGTCPVSSQLGTATVAVGAGTDPYWLTGNVYLTGRYTGDPYGLSVTFPAEAGPFKLAGNAGDGVEVVRAGIAVNPNTAALTVTSDPLPQIVDGVPLRLRTIHIEVNHPGFMLNPTDCTQLSIDATITGAQDTSANTSSPFGPTGCAALPFHPTITATASAQTSRADGASLDVTVTATVGEANIGKVNLTLPKALPSRLSTLEAACTEGEFAANPAGCPGGSIIGTATARTPLLDNPLVGPIYLVSHGSTAFPDTEFVLQGENGLEIVLDGKTQITKGITYSRLESLPDAPIASFEAEFPKGPHSILSAPHNLCTANNLSLGATAIGQNGKQQVKTVPIVVNGCTASRSRPTLIRAQQLRRARVACRKRYNHAKTKRLACDKLARERYGPRKKTKKANRKAVGR